MSLIRAPILFILKKNKGFRLYIDYYRLNTVIIKNRYLLPLITEIFNRLNSFKWFTKLNLKNVYYRLHINSGDK